MSFVSSLGSWALLPWGECLKFRLSRLTKNSLDLLVITIPGRNGGCKNWELAGYGHRAAFLLATPARCGYHNIGVRDFRERQSRPAMPCVLYVWTGREYALGYQVLIVWGGA